MERWRDGERVKGASRIALGLLDAQPWAVDAQPCAVDAQPWAVDAQPWAVGAHPWGAYTSP